MPKYFKYSSTVFLSLTVFILLSAFGCKKQEEDSQDDSTLQSDINAIEQVTYEQNTPEDITGNETSDNDTNNTEENNSEAEDSSDNTQAEQDENKLLLDKADALAEIYGTYTNKDKVAFKNLIDLKQYSTDRLSAWIDEKSQEKINNNAPFYGVTTSALSSVLLEQSNAKSKILTTVKREEITSRDNTPKVSYKVILMAFENVSEVWVLNSIYWQD